MEKLKLDVETLAVDSFAAGAAEAGSGTVHGHATRVTGPCKPTQPYVTCIEPCIPPPP